MPILAVEHVARRGKGVAIALVRLCDGADKPRVASVCKLPDDLALLAEPSPQHGRVGVCKLSDGEDPHQIELALGRAPYHEQLAHRQRPELCRDLLRKQRVRLVGLFKIARHFCQQLVAGDADVYREAKLPPDALAQTIRSHHRRAEQTGRAGHIDPRLVDGKLLDRRRICPQQRDETPRGGHVQLVIRLGNDKIRALLKRLSKRLAGLDAEFLRRSALGKNDAVTRFFVARDHRRHAPQIEAVAHHLRAVRRCP